MTARKVSPFQGCASAGLLTQASALDSGLLTQASAQGSGLLTQASALGFGLGYRLARRWRWAFGDRRKPRAPRRAPAC
jgi:hypothetical protein